MTIWTDGSCQPNPGPGGYAAILRGKDGQQKTLSGGTCHATNNQMELKAAIRALERLKRPCRVTLFSDSEYLVLGMSGRVDAWAASGWRTSKRKPIANADLWQRLVKAAKPHRIEWRWVKGHADDAMNVRVDALAEAARMRAMGFGPLSSDDAAGLR